LIDQLLDIAATDVHVPANYHQRSAGRCGGAIGRSTSQNDWTERSTLAVEAPSLTGLRSQLPGHHRIVAKTVAIFVDEFRTAVGSS
jgi:hypothetical protein